MCQLLRQIGLIRHHPDQTATAGRIENAQVAVYLVYASQAGHAVIDRELYLPRSWTDDAERCRAAGVPDQVGFATKPALATQMICRALAAGVPVAWVAGDEVYGANPKLRADWSAEASARCWRWPATTRSASVALPTPPTP